MCVCVCVHTHTHLSIHTHTQIPEKDSNVLSDLKAKLLFQNYIQHPYDLPFATRLLHLRAEYYENHDFKLHRNS